MTKDELIKFCLTLPKASVDYPYGPEYEVIKNGKGKSFALIGNVEVEPMKRSCGADAPIVSGDIFVTVKCPPELIQPLREQYTAVLPGYYSNKNHWNTIIPGKDVPDDEIKKFIQISYDLVT
ncbi:MAG: MmcQ/YjbR family DNA-binding protein [Firmicutes bacterium]|nr:MmcQ/YjbR family DNA-binding protein [Bacillota bacterium]